MAKTIHWLSILSTFICIREMGIMVTNEIRNPIFQIVPAVVATVANDQVKEIMQI